MLQDIPDGLERVEVRSASVGKPGVSKRQEEINYRWQTVFFVFFVFFLYTRLKETLFNSVLPL